MRLAKVLKVLFLVLAVCLCALSRADDGAPVRFLMPFEGGSGTAVALYLAERANAEYGYHVYVEEKPGASGRIGAMVLKKAAPDAAGTPKKVVDQWSTVLATIVHSPQMTAKLAELGLEPTGSTSDELATALAADIARWAPVVKASGFRAD